MLLLLLLLLLLLRVLRLPINLSLLRRGKNGVGGREDVGGRGARVPVLGSLLLLRKRQGFSSDGPTGTALEREGPGRGVVH